MMLWWYEAHGLRDVVLHELADHVDLELDESIVLLAGGYGLRIAVAIIYGTGDGSYRAVRETVESRIGRKSYPPSMLRTLIEEFVMAAISPVYDFPIPVAEFRLTKLPQKQISYSFERPIGPGDVKAALDQISAQLRQTTLPPGKGPKNREPQIRRNVEWIYKNRVFDVSLRELALGEYHDVEAYRKQECAALKDWEDDVAQRRSSDVSKGIQAAIRYFTIP
jgi:hypothetical protein